MLKNDRKHVTRYPVISWCPPAEEKKRMESARKGFFKKRDLHKGVSTHVRRVASKKTFASHDRGLALLSAGKNKHGRLAPFRTLRHRPLARNNGGR